MSTALDGKITDPALAAFAASKGSEGRAVIIRLALPAPKIAVGFSAAEQLKRRRGRTPALRPEAQSVSMPPPDQIATIADQVGAKLYPLDRSAQYNKTAGVYLANLSPAALRAIAAEPGVRAIVPDRTLGG